MIKKILLGLLLFVVLFVGGVSAWIYSMLEEYPSVDSSVVKEVPGQSLPPELERDINETLQKYRESTHIPSVSVAIGLDNELVYAGAFGYADLEAEIRATPDTLYRTGSVSKSITTLAMGRMMEEGLIDIDQEYQVYVPEFPDKKWPFTLRQLASHTGGIRHYQSPMESYHDVHYDTVADALVLVQDDRLIYEPGTRYSYSSYGFNMLSAAMVAAAGKPFTELLQQYVFEPAGMTDTQAEDAPNPNPDTAAFYNQTETRSFRAPYADNSYKVAGGGLIGTPSDLVRLGNAVLRGDIIGAQTWQELTTPTALNDGSSESGYGLGFGSGEVQIGQRKIKEIGHSGGSVGGITVWKLFPAVTTQQGEHDLVLAVTINISVIGSKASVHEVAYIVAEKVLDALDRQEWHAQKKPETPIGVSGS